MAVPLPLAALILALLTSWGFNVGQGFQNRKLRKQIEKLEKIIRNLQQDLDETKKELRALKIWCFEERSRCRRKISVIKKSIKANKKEKALLEQ